jgi:hypothetical protein
MKYSFNHAAINWLNSKGFSESEEQELLGLIERFEDQMMKKENELVILPKGTSQKVGAFFDLLYLITDAEGIPMCFEETTIRIPNEAKERFSEGMEIAQLETVVGKMATAKFGKEHSYAKRRGSKYG